LPKKIPKKNQIKEKNHLTFTRNDNHWQKVAMTRLLQNRLGGSEMEVTSALDVEGT